MVDDHFYYGAIINVNFNPRSGHEQAGWRPAIIISNDTYNKINKNLRIVCPITHTQQQNPFWIPVTECTKTDGYVIGNQPKALDITSRRAKWVEDAPHLADEVRDLVKTIFEFE